MFTMNLLSKTLFRYRYRAWQAGYSTVSSSPTTTSTDNVPPPSIEVKIPQRIHRGPTDILKALDNTVSYDFTGPPYKFHDDPCLSPHSIRAARSVLFAKEAGMKAAKWVRDQHPELFTQMIADPPVESYMPPKPINANTVCENLLYEKIDNDCVTEAISVYELMQTQNMGLSRDARQALLELLCFYNATDPIPMENVAERFVSADDNSQFIKNVNEWTFHPLVKTLFESMEPKDSAAYSALICGLYKYGAWKEGDELILEAKEKNITLDVSAYNVYISRLIGSYEEDMDKKYEKYMEVLQDMDQRGVKPDLGTLNSIMDALGRVTKKGKFTYMPKLFSEFISQGVQPSLGTYALFLRSYNISQPKEIIDQYIKVILDGLKGMTLEPKSITDSQFFSTVMIASYNSQNLINGIACFDLAHAHKNTRLLGGGRRRITFYNYFLLLLCQKASLETLVSYYKLLVPHVYSPDPVFYKILFEVCDQNGAVELLADFWEDFYATGSPRQETIVKILEVSCSLSSFPLEAAYEARPKLGRCAKTFWEYLCTNDASHSRYQMTDEVCNYILVLLARACEWGSVQSVLEQMQSQLFEPTSEVLQKVVESCIDNDNPDIAVWIAAFCKKNFDIDSAIVTPILAGDFLSDKQKSEVRELFEKNEIDDSSSSSSSSSSESESDESSDSEDISIPKKIKIENTSTTQQQK